MEANHQKTSQPATQDFDPFLMISMGVDRVDSFDCGGGSPAEAAAVVVVANRVEA